MLGEVTASNPLICFGVNPSKAKVINNKLKTDPTILKIKEIIKKNNYDDWIMLNLYPEVTPKPEELKDFKTELHKKNIDKIKEILKKYPNSGILACWGNLINKRDYLKYCLKGLKKDNFKDYSLLGEVNGIIEITKNRKWFHIGNLTKKGNPRHPLSPYADINKELENFDINEYVKDI
ncbi:DUF1643 domain-containing protein [Fusobacterium vincentii]|nr:DUF1643 domain-containing protein [Fusobacterium vincentii]